MFTPHQGRLVLESKSMETHPSQSTAVPAGPRRPIWAQLLAALAAGAVLGALVGALASTLPADWLRAAATSSSGALALASGLGALAGAVAAAGIWAWLAVSPSDVGAAPQAMAEHAAPEPAPAVVETARAMADTEPMMLPAAVPSSFDTPSDIRDALTGAYTQRYFIAAADREWSRIRRHGEDAALLMIDADHLRRINELHGQACGDAVLVQLTRLVIATLRQYDLMARFNAGVLVVYLPQTDPIGAIDVAERIRERIHNFRMSWPTGSVAVTVSVGVASIGANHAELDQVIGDAGAALRAAKQAGRNCVRAAPVPPKRSPATMGGDRRVPGSP